MDTEQELETVLESIRLLWKERAEATLTGEKESLSDQLLRQLALLREVLDRA